MLYVNREAAKKNTVSNYMKKNEQSVKAKRRDVQNLVNKK